MSGSAMTGAGSGPAGNLPAEISSFVGREAELADLDRLLDSARLVTLTGVGGIGKTRLALRAAHRIGDRFPDGVWFAELAQLQDPLLLPHVVARVLEVQDQTNRPLIDVLADYLAERHSLLILDTCEHLIDSCAMLAAALLAAAPRLRILATSRRPLTADGEQVRTLSPLTVPETEGSADVRECEAVRLFSDRAREVAPEFAVTGDNQGTVARLCRRLDGLPLALELAAPWLRSLPVETIADRLDDRFRLLIRQAGEEPGRHEALRTTIGWSHELCTPAERLMWARASVFAGAFDRYTALEVCAGGPLAAEELPRVLAELTRKSILMEDSAGPNVRYRMLATVREYGIQWLRALGEERATRRRHRDFYRNLARLAYGRWMGPKQVTWYQRIEAEHPDTRVALEFCLTDPEPERAADPGAGPGGAALEMTGDLWFFWYACGFQREGRRYLERALAYDHTPSPHRTRAAWALGLITLSQGDLAATDECIAACQADTGPDGVAASTFLEGSARALQGDHAQTLKLLDSLDLDPEHGGMHQAIWLLERGVRAFAHVLLGDLPVAATLAEEARAESAARGERALQAWADYVQALADLGMGNAASATERARSALVNKRPLHDTWFMALAMDVLAMAVAAQGEPARAARLLGIGQRIWQAHGLPQLGAPELITARRDCEQRLRDALGHPDFESAFARGLSTDLDDGITFALG